MSPRTILHIIAVVVLALIVLVAVRLHSAAAASDPHALYEQKCARCHAPHAGALAQKSVKRVDGVAVGAKSGLPLTRLLASHMGVALGPEDIATLAAHFDQMLTTGFLFQEKCIVCHDRASELARLSLVEADGRLVGRYSGRDIAEFLTGHGRLTEAEATTMLATLRRQLERRDDSQQPNTLNEDKDASLPGVK